MLEDHEDDPVVEELTSFVNCLSEDEQIDLVALTWLGRDDYSASDWSTVREEAARAHNERTANYLLGTPLVGDFLEEGLSMLGYSCEEFEIRHGSPAGDGENNNIIIASANWGHRSSKNKEADSTLFLECHQEIPIIVPGIESGRDMED